MHSHFLQSTAPGISLSRRIEPPVPRQAVPWEQWPGWAKLVALDRAAADAGVGDTVERTIGEPASKAFQSWYLKLFKKSCGCERRKGEWNQQYCYQNLAP